MFPKSTAQELAHRLRKRGMEIDLVLRHIREYLGEPAAGAGVRQVLEFGMGSGFQLPHLQELGSVVGLDQYISEGARAHVGIELVEASITSTPFEDGRFDLIYSNHVIEHIEDLPAAFDEMKRIGKPDCLYAFSMPTNVWLMLAIPGQYYTKFRHLLLRPRGTVIRSGDRAVVAESRLGSSPARRRPFLSRLGGLLAVPGHGVTTNFLACYRSFRTSSWRRLFEDHGFRIEAVQPLLLYGPSQWPIIPILPPYRGLCSSVLLLLRK